MCCIAFFFFSLLLSLLARVFCLQWTCRAKFYVEDVLSDDLYVNSVVCPVAVFTVAFLWLLILQYIQTVVSYRLFIKMTAYARITSHSAKWYQVLLFEVCFFVFLSKSNCFSLTLMIPPLAVEVLVFIPAVLHSAVKCSSVHWRSASDGANRITSFASNVDVTTSSIMDISPCLATSWKNFKFKGVGIYIYFFACLLLVL